MKGPTPQPLALRVAAGNPGCRPLHGVPNPEPGEPECPPHLDYEAQLEWHRLVGQLAADGLMTERDRASFALYCMAWSRWVKAEKELAKRALVMRSGDKRKENPYLAISVRAMEQLLKILQEFGLSPAARMRVRVDPSRGNKKSKAAGYF